MTTKVPVELSSTPGIVDGSNATAITIDSSERVGVGTASPDTMLHINGSANSEQVIITGNGNSGRGLSIQTAASGGQQDAGVIFDAQDTEANANPYIVHKLAGANYSNLDGTGNSIAYNMFADSGSNEGSFRLKFYSDGSSAEQWLAYITMQQGSGDGAAQKSEMLFGVADNGNPATAMTIYNNKVVNFANAFAVNNASTAFTNTGLVGFSDGGVNMVRSGDTVVYINRLSDDGAVVSICQAGSQEGTISVSGATVSYNGFSGNHESSGIPTNTPVGTVVSTIDELDVYADKTTQLDDTGKTIKIDNPKAGKTRADHAKVKVSDTVGDSAVYGVVNSFDEHDKAIITSVGVGSVKVTGACSKGDLLESNGDGTAKVQSDDIVRSKTIGKVTIGNSNTGVKLVSCVLYCG